MYHHIRLGTDIVIDYETMRYCVQCNGYQSAYVSVADGDTIDITCAECGTQYRSPRFA